MRILSAFKKYDCSVCKTNKVTEKSAYYFNSTEGVYLYNECNKLFQSYGISYLRFEKIPQLPEYIQNSINKYKDIFSFDVHIGSMYIDTKHYLFSCGDEYVPGKNPIFNFNDFELFIDFRYDKVSKSKVFGKYMAQTMPINLEDEYSNYFSIDIPISERHQTKVYSYEYKSYRNVPVPTEEDIKKANAEVRKAAANMAGALAFGMLDLLITVGSSSSKNDTWRSSSYSSNTNTSSYTNPYEPDVYECTYFDHQKEHASGVVQLIHSYLRGIDADRYNPFRERLYKGLYHGGDFYPGEWIFHAGYLFFVGYKIFIHQYLLVNSAFDRKNKDDTDEVMACARLDDSFVYCLLYCEENRENYFGGTDSAEHDGLYYIQKERMMYFERLNAIWEQNSDAQPEQLTETLTEMVTDVIRIIDNEKKGLPADYVPEEKKKGFRLFGKGKKK